MLRQEMPGVEQKWELHPIERKLVAKWCVDYLKKVKTPEDQIPPCNDHGFNPVVERVWNSDWFDMLNSSPFLFGAEQQRLFQATMYEIL